MLFADTSYLIALLRVNDAMHHRAAEIEKQLAEPVLTTDNVFSEFITYASAKEGNKAAYGAGVKLLKSELRVVCIDETDLPLALEHVRRIPGLSMCDALSAVVMKKLGVRRILSFDSDFDDLGFERIS